MKDLAKAVSGGVQRRMRARTLYRKRRDRKIAVDFIGKWFELEMRSELPNRSTVWLRMQLVWYKPETSMVGMRFVDFGSAAWFTDKFWSMYRTGTLRDA